jgi:hypothetical protein
VLLALVLPAGTSVRTTWDEPWHEEVVKNADSFVLARVIAVDEGRQSAMFRVVRSLAGVDVTPVFTVDGFCLLRLMSYSSGHEPRLPRSFHPGAEVYLFLRIASDGRSYEFATPTTGYALVDGDRVRACYRHSYHLALVTRDLYERTQTAIFRYLHGGAVDSKLMTELAKGFLGAPPALVEDDPMSAASLTFFNQHAALETFYYLGSESDLALLEPFLRSPHGHIQTSAVRALSRIATLPAKRRLLEFLTGSGEAFAKAQAVAGLRRQNARELAGDLERALPRLDPESTGFGGDLMDPRIGTHQQGSALAAAKALLAEWAVTPR